MVEKSKDYVKLRELLDNKMIVPITYISLAQWNFQEWLIIKSSMHFVHCMKLNLKNL